MSARSAQLLGITIRHEQACSSRTGAQCNCSPSYRAKTYDKTAVHYDAQGKRRLGKQRYGTWRKSLAQARGDYIALAHAVANRTLPAAGPGRPASVEDACEKWMEGAKAGLMRNRSGRTYKPSVLRGYEGSLRLHVLPLIGRRKFPEVTRADVQDLVDRLSLAMAGESVRGAVTALRVVYRHALSRNLVTTNPCVGLELPATNSQRFGGTGQRDRIPSAAESAALIAAAPESDRALWATAFYTGLRRGELQGLLIENIHLDERLMDVVWGWDQREGRVRPKFDSSIRRVPIIDVLIDMLRDHIGQRTSGIVFPSAANPDRPFVPWTIQSRADAAWDEADLDRVTLHETRHTFASLMIDGRVPIKSVSEFMGHSSTAITERVYAHLLPHSLDDALALMNTYIASALSGPA